MNIVLQTDFSLTWPAVAEMKGVIKNISPNVDIFDANHEIKKFSAFEASVSLARIVDYWPSGTIFVSVVDPGVGTSRKAAIAKLKNDSYVISPDNGSLSLLKDRIEKIYEIKKEVRYKNDSEVFHGRDIFGYVAALLSIGKDINDLADEYNIDDIIMSLEALHKPIFKENKVETIILTGIKHYGCLELNINNEDWRKLFKLHNKFLVTIYHKDKEVYKDKIEYVNTFGDVNKGEALLYCGSSNRLSIDLNEDNFMEKYNISFGIDWKIILEVL